jgi:hypothetical protein
MSRDAYGKNNPLSPTRVVLLSCGGGCCLFTLRQTHSQGFLSETDAYDGHSRFGNYEVPRFLCGGAAMRLVLIFFIVVLFCQAIIHLPVESRGMYGPVQWQSDKEKKEFHRLLRKHGQHRVISVIFYDGSKTYFINEKGEKCLFK